LRYRRGQCESSKAGQESKTEWGEMHAG
jgi:hypothetical protein